MKIEFKESVKFSTIHRAFTGEGIPPIPEDARRLAVTEHTVAYIAPTGEAWAHFDGSGTTQTSQTYYWPTIEMCPRAWARGLTG
jgi:hypothetical protein